MTPLAAQRAGIVFDALVMAGDKGMVTARIHELLIQAGLAAPSSSPQIVRLVIDDIRRVFSADDPGSGHEVVTCVKRAHLSTYRIALSPDDALRYRQRRCAEIATTIRTIYRQIGTERERFGGAQVFTEAAFDYLGMAMRELERGASMSLVVTS